MTGNRYPAHSQSLLCFSVLSRGLSSLSQAAQVAWILEEGQTGSAIPEVSDLDMLIPLCLLESPRGPVATLLMETMEGWRRSKPTQESGHISAEGSVS